MATSVSEKYLEKVEVHFSKGIPVQRLNMTEDGKLRLRICKEVYMRFVDNPMMDVRKYIHNKYPDRTMSEIGNDAQVINYILGFMDKACRNIEKYKVNAMSDKMARIGDSKGDADALGKAATIKIKIHQLDQPDSEADAYENIAAMPIAITSDVTVVNPDMTNHTDEQRKKLFEDYGASQSEIQDLLKNSKGEYEFAPTDEEPEPDIYLEDKR